MPKTVEAADGKPLFPNGILSSEPKPVMTPLTEVIPKNAFGRVTYATYMTGLIAAGLPPRAHSKLRHALDGLLLTYLIQLDEDGKDKKDKTAGMSRREIAREIYDHCLEELRPTADKNSKFFSHKKNIGKFVDSLPDHLLLKQNQFLIDTVERARSFTFDEDFFKRVANALAIDDPRPVPDKPVNPIANWKMVTDALQAISDFDGPTCPFYLSGGLIGADYYDCPARTLEFTSNMIQTTVLDKRSFGSHVVYFYGEMAPEFNASAFFPYFSGDRNTSPPSHLTLAFILQPVHPWSDYTYASTLLYAACGAVALGYLRNIERIIHIGPIGDEHGDGTDDRVKKVEGIASFVKQTTAYRAHIWGPDRPAEMLNTPVFRGIDGMATGNLSPSESSSVMINLFQNPFFWRFLDTKETDRQALRTYMEDMNLLGTIPTFMHMVSAEDEIVWPNYLAKGDANGSNQP